MRHRVIRLLSCLALIAVAAAAGAQEPPAPSKGQLVYLPVYSHIYHGSLDRKGKPGKVMLSALVSIRNTDPRRAIRVASARYFDTEGRLLREFVPVARSIPAFGTFELFVEQHDDSGGSGANFAIAWDAETPVNPPLIEAVHATIEGARSLTFTTTGRPIRAPE
ncbi:MAG: DUF3124 domain-containing protein [Rhodocyclales bacterium]|nr:DUF3124 domain-containing protein [Rhodocyclales bacterium]